MDRKRSEKWVVPKQYRKEVFKVLTCAHIVITVRKAKQSTNSLVKAQMDQIARTNIVHRTKVLILHVAANWHKNFSLFQVRVSPATMTWFNESER